MQVFKAAVVGAGTMGGQIAQTIAAAGIPVVLKDIKQEFIDAGVNEARGVTAGQMARPVKKGRMTQEQADAQVEEVVGRITGTLTYEGFGDVDLVIEAVPEIMDLKKRIFAELDANTPGHAILASNTSSLSITEIAESTLRPEKVIGFHYFYPASVMPLIEIIEGEETSSDTVQAVFNFAQSIRKQPITCGEVPGFVVNRILMSAACEIWRLQEEQGLSIKKIDEGVAAANVVPMGPFMLIDLLGLDTVLHVAEHLHDSYGDRIYIPESMRQLVEDGKLGAKTGGNGYFSAGEPNVEGDAEPDSAKLADMLAVKALREACLVLEERVCTVREIDLGLMAGAGMDPRRGILPPFWRADAMGLGNMLEKMEGFHEEYGDRFEPPLILRRLVAQGKLGVSTGSGFYAWPRPDEGEQRDTVKLETRGDVAVAWLQNLPMNSISPQVIEDLSAVWDTVKSGGQVRALVIASGVPVVFSAGADIKAFTSMDEEGGVKLLAAAHALYNDLGSGRIGTVAAVNAIAYGGGCELAMACDVRIAAESAVFGQPEINLGIIPGFGGTQRLPRLVGVNKALEMNLLGDAITADEALVHGLVNRVVPDHELIDTALHWARALAQQAPVAVEQIKQVSAKGDLDAGIEAEKQGFFTVFVTEDAKEGIGAFLEKRQAQFKGR